MTNETEILAWLRAWSAVLAGETTMTNETEILAWLQAAIAPEDIRELSVSDVRAADEAMVGACGKQYAHLLTDAGGEEAIAQFTQKEYGRRPQPTTRTDAVDLIEPLLGADGSRALAERIVDRVGWREAPATYSAMSEHERNALLSECVAAMEGE